MVVLKLVAKGLPRNIVVKVSAAIDVSDLIGKEVAEAGALSTRNLTEKHKAMVDKVASEITSKFDEVLKVAQRDLVSKGFAMVGSGTSGGCGCGCGPK